jgi:hypothetical protein
LSRARITPALTSTSSSMPPPPPRSKEKAEKAEKKKAGRKTVEVAGHILVQNTFKKPRHCNFCSDLLWGLKHQGLTCRRTGSCHAMRLPS